MTDYSQFIVMPEVISSSLMPDLSEHPGEGPTQEFPLHQRKEQKRQSRPAVAAAAACTSRARALAVVAPPDCGTAHHCRCMDSIGFYIRCGIVPMMDGRRK